jgi:O-acetyl-ADP-ribose deacetylase (regulator of RNase III)
MGELKYITGDATKPRGIGNKIVCHICNDQGLWGSGFVLSLARRWPETREAYKALHTDCLVLGTVQIVPVKKDITVANMIAQHETIRTNDHPLDYAALEVCLRAVGQLAKLQGSSVHMPRIGCGLAGGKWELILPLIRESLIRENIDVYVYTLEGDSSWR